MLTLCKLVPSPWGTSFPAEQIAVSTTVYFLFLFLRRVLNLKNTHCHIPSKQVILVTTTALHLTLCLNPAPSCGLNPLSGLCPVSELGLWNTHIGLYNQVKVSGWELRSSNDIRLTLNCLWSYSCLTLSLFSFILNISLLHWLVSVYNNKG